MMKREFVDDDFIHIWYEDGILNVVYKVSRLDIEYAKRVVEEHMKVDLGSEYPVFIDITSIKSASKDARDYLSSDAAIQNVSASAMLAGSVISKLMGTFFLAFNKPATPIKLFTEKDEAIRWLSKYVKDENTQL